MGMRSPIALKARYAKGLSFDCSTWQHQGEHEQGKAGVLARTILEFRGKMMCMPYSWGPLMLLRGNPAYRAAADANGSRHALCLFSGQKNQDV